MISTELLLASHNPVNNCTLYTFKLMYPRIILAEVNTHRNFSRSTASSRAIPSSKFRQKIFSEPFTPISIGQYQAGMQAGEELDGWRRYLAEKIYACSRYPMLLSNFLLEKLGAHKQVQNRLLEPWMWVEQIVSSTEWSNFLSLRDHKAAEPHIQVLAKQIKEKIFQSNLLINIGKLNPDLVARCKFDNDVQKNTHIAFPGYVHTPLIYQDECSLPVEDRMKISGARCARVSYFLPDSTKRSSIEADEKLFQKLAGSHPKHLSPFEHQAYYIENTKWYGNFRGWKQYRKTFEGESGEPRDNQTREHAALQCDNSICKAY